MAWREDESGTFSGTVPFHRSSAGDAVRLRAERRFPLEGMQDDSLEEIAEGDVVIFGEAFEDFENAFLDAQAGLYSLYFRHGTIVPRYQATEVAGSR